jgi:hypothetical protein
MRRARLKRHLTLGMRKPAHFSDDSRYVVTEWGCPKCGTVLGTRDSFGAWQSARERQPDGSAFFPLPHAETCSRCREQVEIL